MSARHAYYWQEYGPRYCAHSGALPERVLRCARRVTREEAEEYTVAAARDGLRVVVSDADGSRYIRCYDDRGRAPLEA